MQSSWNTIQCTKYTYATQYYLQAMECLREYGAFYMNDSKVVFSYISLHHKAITYSSLSCSVCGIGTFILK